ncbi:acyltransferase [Pontibacter qinzhouensis]|uniref:Acyltransferase n=1 Tax=Pontibacter qinzhouensis TaxID=2603253 RepID=A0A5C8JK22_9BACT|nr:acyltransferase family protein [Pontibacter qinzhouensis]TXK37024.1 acyltransferase [Pontibacter qinzhouensis]
MRSATPLQALNRQHKKVRYQQIDVIKGLATVAVILLHAFTYEELLSSFAIFHIWQAVPLFMILMGLNLGLSPVGSQTSLAAIYNSKGFRKKVKRIVVPVLVLYGVALAAGGVWHYFTGEDKIQFKWLSFLGLLPVTGRGNYFITLVLQSLVLLPFIGHYYQRLPGATIVVLIVLEVVFLLWFAPFTFSVEQTYLYSAAFPRYFSAIAFGLVLSEVVVLPLQKKRLLPLLLLALASAVFLYQILYNISDFDVVRQEWQTQFVLSFGYAALLVLLLFRFLPNWSENWVLSLLARIGKASYHIFLIQIVYFGLVAQEYSFALALAICLPAGYVFFLLESKLLQGRPDSRKH